MSLASLVGVLDGKPIVRAVFSDESTTKNDQPITVVAGILLNLDTQCDPLINDIEAALAAAYGNEGRSTFHEMKGSKLARDLRTGREEGQHAAAVLDRVLPLVHSHQFTIFYGALDHQGYVRSKEYYEGLRQPLGVIWGAGMRPDLAFAECLIRVNRYVSTFVPPEKVLWIHDNAGPMTIAKYAELQFYRSIEVIHTYLNFEANKRQITYGIGKAGLTLPTPNIRIADTIFFGDSASSRLLQYADLCCSVISAHLLVAHGYIGANDTSATLASYYSLIQDSVASDGSAPMLSRARSSFSIP